MMDYLISMFIDDELNIDDKIKFVENVHEDMVFKNESIELLNLEKRLQSEVVYRVPAIEIKTRKKFHFPKLRSMGLLVSALATAVIILFFSMTFRAPLSTPHRFVIYRPDVGQVEIAGTFTEWERIPMTQLGSSGYWEISLDLSKGEHQFAYILDGRQRIADPTIPAREQDDFGSENSIFYKEG